MNIITKLKRVARTGLVVGAITAAVVGTGLYLGRGNSVEAATSCDKVNVIYCGLAGSTTSEQIASFKKDYDSNVSGHASSPTVKHDYHDVQTIYNYVGANKSLVDGMTTSNTVVGLVHRNGEITVGSRVVATNARVAARFSVSGATLIPGTNAYLRTTTSSFAHDTEAALIREDSNGNILFAAIIGCGNAVKGYPIPQPPKPTIPAYNINKEVAVKGSSSYAKSVSVMPGTHVTYRVTVKSTGSAPVTNLLVKDKLPAGVEYVANSLKRDGNAVSSSDFFGAGVKIASLKNGTATVFSFEAIVGPSDTPQQCYPGKLPNTASMSADKLPGQSSEADVNKSCQPKPVYACTSLTDSMVSRTKFDFNAKASASNGATITGYNFAFGDGAKATVATAAASTMTSHAYAAAGTYKATVSVDFKVPGLNGTQTVTSEQCAVTVTVKPAPAAECTDLELKQGSNPRFITATVTYTVSNGATLKNVSFDWNDGTTTDNGTKVSANHTYQKDGSFNVVATLSFSSSSDEVANSTCQAPITITTVMPTCDKLTLDVNNDDKTVTVNSFGYTANNGTYQSTDLNWGDGTSANGVADITGQSHQYASDGPFTVTATAHFTVNGQDATATSAACQQTVSFTETPTPPVTPPTTPPTELVNTGAGSVFGLFAAAASIGGVLYHFVLRRKLSV